MLSWIEKQTCKKYDDNLKTCNQVQTLFSVQINDTQCEMTIILDQKNAQQTCVITEERQIWIPLTQEKYLFALKTSKEITFICSSTKTMHLTGSGILTLYAL